MNNINNIYPQYVVTNSLVFGTWAARSLDQGA